MPLIRLPVRDRPIQRGASSLQCTLVQGLTHFYFCSPSHQVFPVRQAFCHIGIVLKAFATVYDQPKALPLFLLSGDLNPQQ